MLFFFQIFWMPFPQCFLFPRVNIWVCSTRIDIYWSSTAVNIGIGGTGKGLQKICLQQALPPAPPKFNSSPLKVTLPETNSSHLKMDGWKPPSFLLGSPIVRGKLLVSRDCTIPKRKETFSPIVYWWDSCRRSQGVQGIPIIFPVLSHMVPSRSLTNW